MSLKGLTIGAVILLALAGAVYWSENKAQKEAASPGKDAAAKLITLKEDDVQRVEIQRAAEPPTVVQRSKNGSWELLQPRPLPVDSDAVTTLVSTMTALSWDRLVEENAGSNLGTFGLQNPAVRVTITGKDKKKQTVYIGDETPTGGGYFARLEGDPRVFSVYSGTKTSLDKSWKDLRDKRLITVDDSKLTRVEVAAKGSLVEFGKNAGGEWQIVKPRPLRADNLQVDEMVRKVRDAKMDTAVSDEDAAKAAGKFAAGTRMGVVNLTDASGTQTLEIRKNGEEYYAKSSVVEGFHKVDKDLGEALNKGLDDFRNKKLFDFGWSDPSKLEIRDLASGQSYHLTKGGEKWWSNGKEMDATSVQSLIDKLRELTAMKFVEGGFTTPVLEITVTSNDGKRVEKTAVSKSGNSFFAKRENEPAIYEVDSKRIEEIQRAAADVKAPPPPAKK